MGASEEALAVAERALGVASRDLGAPGRAVTHLESAVAHARSAGSSLREGEARVSLALAYMQVGESRRALLECTRAAAVPGIDKARLLMNRALILQRLGREQEALRVYDAAFAAAHTAHNIWAEARILSNRGVLLAYRGDFARSLADFSLARALHLELGAEVAATEVLHNTGFAMARSGDLPGALARYDEATAGFSRLGLVRIEPLLDRCELLIEMGLLPEARVAAEAAIAGCEAMGRSVDAAEAKLMLARVCLVQDDLPTAAAVAGDARRQLMAQRRNTWALLASFVELQTKAASEAATPALARDARRMARRLQRAGWSTAALESLLVSATASVAAGDTTGAQKTLEMASEARRQGPAALRVRAWHAEALLRSTRGDAAGAFAALRAGLRVADEHRDTLGATELRVRSKAIGSDLAELGLNLALQSAQAAPVFEWLERWRANMLAPGNLRPARDPELARLLGLLRQVASRARALALAGRDPSAELRRQSALELEVRRREIAVPGRGAAPNHSPAAPGRLRLTELQAVLGERLLVELFSHEGFVHAIAVNDGEAVVIQLGALATIERERASQLFALGRIARRRAGGALEAAAHELRESSRRLGQLLFGPLERWLEEREVVLVPAGDLLSLGWSLLPALRARPVSLVPSAQLWLERSSVRRRPIPSRTGGRGVALVAGPDVASGPEEIAALRDRFYPGAAVLAGEAATAGRVRAAMERAEIVHMAVHGEFRRDSPQFSSILLADGPLNVFDLETLTRSPQTMILSACDLALMHAPAGGEPMGPVAALLGLGSRTVIASVAPVPEQGAGRFVRSLHEHLSAGQPPATALAAAQQRHSLASFDPEEVAAGSEEVAAATAGAGFVCFGEG